MRDKAHLVATLFITLITLILTINAMAGLLPDTGQTKCYDNYEEISCPQPGEDFYGQDAQYAPCNPQSYTKLDASGNDLPDDAPWPWAMVRDNVTGLVWEVKTDDDASIHYKDNLYNWRDAQSVFFPTLNSQNFGGHSDWRWPTVEELSTLVDSSIPYPGPTINTDYFPNTDHGHNPPYSPYWSSTSSADVNSLPFRILFATGKVDSYYGKERFYYVRAVRAGQPGSFGDYTDNGDGTVTDTETGLMWQKDTDPGIYNWEDALSYCENLSLAGYSDWRLPNRNELHSLVDYSQFNPSIDTDYFPNTVSNPYDYYWSSTTYASDRSLAWLVHFYDGDVDEGDGDGDYNKFFFHGQNVRAVRSGQCELVSTTTTTTTPDTTSTTTTSFEPTTTTTTSPLTTTTPPSRPCTAELIYGEHSEKAELLRYFRDNILSTTQEGQELIKLYYQWSPLIVRAMEEDEEFKEEVKGLIDEVLLLIE